MDDVTQCPQCLGDGVDGISFLGVFACPRCDGRGTVKENLTVEPLSKTYKFDLDQLTQWVADGCPEGVSGIPAQVAELIAFARHRTNHAQAEPVAWMHKHPHLGLSPETERLTEGDAANGWTETPLYTHPPAQDVAALVEENRRLQQALVDHNDRLRSAQSVALRGGAETNWLTFRGAVTYTLAEHHETVEAARAALAKFGDKP